MLRRLVLILLATFTFTFAQMWFRPDSKSMFSFGLLAFAYLVLASLLFSIIFWAVYLVMVKWTQKKEKKE